MKLSVSYGGSSLSLSHLSWILPHHNQKGLPTATCQEWQIPRNANSIRRDGGVGQGDTCIQWSRTRRSPYNFDWDVTCPPPTPLPSERMLDLLELLSKTQTHRHNPFQMATDLGTHRCRRSWEIDMLKLRAATGLWTDGSAVKDTCCSGEERRSLPNTNTRKLSIASYSSSRRPDTFFWPPQAHAHTQCTHVTLQHIHIK